MLKVCEKGPDFRGKVMCSAGIGSGYEMSYNAKRNRYKGKDTKETYKMEDGVELPLPSMCIGRPRTPVPTPYPKRNI